jgi:hypothetical protein
MKLSEIKNHLVTAQSVNFKLPSGAYVPEQFHVTEVGIVTKHFIDCGGTERKESVANFQLWNANDYDHRLKPQKLLGIISLVEKKLSIEDLEIEVEYQTETIGKYALAFNGKEFLLTPKQTACLASEACGLPSYSDDTQKIETSCALGGGCC